MSFPSLPTSVDRYVREILNRMLGRIGKAGDRVLFLSDLVNVGLAKEKGNALSQTVNGDTKVGDLITPIAGAELPDTPTTPENLSAAGIYNAAILQWTPPAYKGHNHTEVWRAQEDDREQADLVHESSGSRYTDVIGSSTPHYYWIRHVNDAGQTSGYNQLAGTLVTPSRLIDVDDLVLNHPEVQVQPFSVVNLGTEENPNHVIVMNGDVLLDGHLNISALQSGELQSGTAMTVGQGSIELSTASDGYGQIVITGQGGVAGNDYMVMKEGSIESFVYTEDAGHIPYKEVRRRETGTAISGQQVKIPAYFKSQPHVDLFPRDITIYNEGYRNQSQRLEIVSSPPVRHPTEAGAWLFTPVARLVLAASSTSVERDWTKSTNSNDISVYVNELTNLTNITLSLRANSKRHTGSGNTYQNRKVTMSLYYRITDTSSWHYATSSVVNINQFNTHSISLIQSFSPNTYDLRIRFVAADRDGTFISGVVDYNDHTEQRSLTKHNYSDFNGNKTFTEYIDAYIPANAEIVSASLTGEAHITMRARTLFAGTPPGQSVNNVVRGHVQLNINTGSTTSNLRFDSPDTTPYSNSRWHTKTYVQPFEWSLSEHLPYPNNRQVRRENFYSGSKSYYGYSYNSYNPQSTSSMEFEIRNLNLTIEYRTPVANTGDSANQFFFDNYEYQSGATDIGLSDSIITWTATGE